MLYHPFFPSTLRDGGYDVADYCAVAPEYGTVDDCNELLEAAHAGGLRIIIDLVMNHTSDQHPWFQACRPDPDGPSGGFYVRRGGGVRQSDAGILFVVSE